MTTATPTELPAGPARPATRRWAVLAVLCISLLVVNLDTTVLNVAIPQIVRSLHASASDLQWVVDVYALVFAGLLLVFGNLGDRLGRKWVLAAGVALFGIGSAASAFSGTPDRLVAARAFMGVGAAAIMPSTLSVLTNVFTGPGERARAIGIWSGTTGLGVAIGPVLGGWLLAHYWWGSVFIVNVPICAAGLIAMLWVVPNSRDPAAKRADLAGAVLSTGGMALLLWGIIDAPERGWTSPVVLCAILGGAAVLFLFVQWERRSDHPMLELSFFRSRRFSVAVAAMGLVIFALLGGLFLFTQYLQFSLGYSPLAAGLRIGPIALVLVVVAPMSIVLDRHIGTKAVVGTGMGIMVLAFGLLSLMTVHSSYYDALPAFVLIGVGTGLAFAPCTEAVMGSVSLERAGIGSATNSASLQVGGATGVAVLGSLLNTRYQGRLTPLLAHHPVPHSVLEIILGSLGGALAVAGHVGGTLGASLAAAARSAFMDGVDLALLVAACVVGAAALIVVAALPDRPHAARATPSVAASTGVRRVADGYRGGMTAFEDRRSGRDRDWTDAESEGQPATEDQPPGIDAETASEGTPLPADHPVGSTEIGVTEVEEAIPETLEERVARERPDVPQVPPDDPGGRLSVGAMDPNDEVDEGEWAADHAGLSAEEAAVHIEEG